MQGLIFLYFAQALDASPVVCGLSVLVTVSFEVPLFILSKRLVTALSPRALITGALRSPTERRRPACVRLNPHALRLVLRPHQPLSSTP